MFWLCIHRVTVLTTVSLRALHWTHAAFTIEHDWPVIAHGAVPVSSMFAAYVLAEGFHQVALWTGRRLRADASAATKKSDTSVVTEQPVAVIPED